MTSPKREPVITCKIGTFKYFFPEDKVFEIWEKLEKRYGPITTTAYVMQIHSPAFVFRSSPDGNPIIVMRRRRCTEDDIHELHELFNFQETHA